MNQLIILEKIAIIEKAIQQIKESISIDSNIETNENVIQWDKHMQDKTKSLIHSLINKYGYNVPINRNDKIVAKLEWEHKVKDLSQILKTLKIRNFCEIEYNENKTRMVNFTFIKK